MSTNPYQSPTPFGDPTGYALPGAPPKPVAGVVFGILNLAYGVLTLLCNGASSVMFFIPIDPAEMEANAAMRLMHENDFYRIFNQASLVISLLSGVVLIVAGIGLLQMRPYGRLLSIGYGIYDLISILLGLIVNGMLLFPLLIDQMNNATGAEQFGAVFGLAAGIIGTVVALVYPIILLVFMYRPKMIEAYRPLPTQ